MQSRWSDDEARAMVREYAERGVGEDVALRVYTSRCIGADPALVLHGGGNTSVKTTAIDDTGRSVNVLCVKGSGWDLGRIEPAGLPAVRLDSLMALRSRGSLSDEDMVNAQRTRLLDSRAPNPSVETLLHAFLPHKFIDHSHADAILSIVDQPDAEAICRRIYGARLGVVPYVMPGFALSKLAAEVYASDPSVQGLLLLKHGLFTFGDTAKQSYERHIEAVSAAESYVAERRVQPAAGRAGRPVPGLLPLLRGVLGDQGRRYLLRWRASPSVDSFVCDPDLHSLSQRGTATPDHVIRTKALPLLLADPSNMGLDELKGHIVERVSAYRRSYRAYVARQIERTGRSITPLDADPRVILVPGVGLITAGATSEAADVAADLYEHTIEVIRGAESVGCYEPVGEDDLFDMEYWSLEQAKLARREPGPLQGRAVYITGAARGIGMATARAFAKAGASLFLVDLDPAVASVAAELGCAHAVLDVCDEAAVKGSFEAMIATFGGVDGVVSNAGTAPQADMGTCTSAELLGSLQINLLAHQSVAASAVAVLRLQQRGGFLLFNASKAALNPGVNFGPYAVAKAGLIALMKQHALEGGPHGIRSSAVNADRVRTALLPEAMVRERAAARGLDADAYFRSNLLRREVCADDVAQAFLYLALAPSTTGAIVTVDGGNIAASVR